VSGIENPVAQGRGCTDTILPYSSYAVSSENFIHALEHHGQWLVVEDRKADAGFEFFDDILGAPTVRASRINLGCLDLPWHDLSSLCDKFTEEEVWATICSLPPDKAPGTDGFTGRFLQVAWPIIQKDLMSALDAF
jgi:hypothetical protein